MPFYFEGPKWDWVTYGTPATVTWSFADSDIEPFLAQTYPGYPDFDFTLGGAFRDQARLAFAAWDALAGIDFQEVSDSAQSNIRLGQLFIDGPGPYLADDWYWSSSGLFTAGAIAFDRDAFVDLNTFYGVVLHEIGHVIGLAHTYAPNDLMFPTHTYDEPLRFSPDDIAGVRFLYGRDPGTPSPEVSIADIPSLNPLTQTWAARGTADFTGDGTADILWRNSTTNETALWVMNDGHISSIPNLNALSQDWQVEGTADFTRDGTADVLWRNPATNETALWVMQGGQIAAIPYLNPISQDWQVEGTADFTRDGSADILWRNVATNETALWVMWGGQIAAIPNLNPISQDWQVEGTADFTGDGTADVFLA